MKLNIEVESGAFEKVILDGINSLTQDEIKDMIKQVFVECFSKCEDFKHMLMTYETNRWGGPAEAKLGPLAEAAIKSIELDEALAPFKAKMVRSLIENHQKVVENMLFNCMVEKIANDQNLYFQIRNAVQTVMAEREANR